MLVSVFLVGIHVHACVRVPCRYPWTYYVSMPSLISLFLVGVHVPCNYPCSLWFSVLDRYPCSWGFLCLLLINFIYLFLYLFIWILVERLISRWAQNTSQWQLQRYSVSEETHGALVVCHSEWVTVDIHSDLLTAQFSSYTADATWKCCCLGAGSVYNTQPCTRLLCHFIRSHIRKVHV